MKAKPHADNTPAMKLLQVRLPQSTEEKLKEGVKATGLSRADVARLSLERGVDILIQQLGTTPKQAA